MTPPAVRVSSVRPEANYLSGAPHSCSPPTPHPHLSPLRPSPHYATPPHASSSSSSHTTLTSLHVINQSVFLSSGCTSREHSWKQIQYPPRADFTSVRQCEEEKKKKKETATTLHCDQKTTRTRSFTKGHRWSSGLLSEKLITTTRPATVPWFESRASGAIRCDFPLQTIFLGGGNGLKLDPLAACRSCTAASGITMLKRCSSAITSRKFR